MSRSSFSRVACVAIGVVTAMVMAGCEPMSRQVSAGQVDQLTARCQDAMLREACVAQKDRSGLLQRGAAPAASQVFVAGVGAIDAGAYNDIRTAGEAMCGMVKSKCNADWEGGACKTARSLWPSPGQRAPAG